MDDDKKAGHEPADIVKVGPDLGEGVRPFVRQKGEEVAAGVLCPMREGQPLNGADVVALHPTGEPDAFRVETLYAGGKAAAPAPAGESKGPAKVTTPAYRQGWDALFGKKPTVGVA